MKHESFTDKAFRDLSDEESENLKKALLSIEYENIEGVFVAKSKKEFEKEETLKNEIEASKILVSLGHQVYLLPFQYAQDKDGKPLHSSDSLTDNEFLEIKTVRERIRGAYFDSRSQGKDVFIDVQNDISEKDAIKEVYRGIGNAKNFKPNTLEGKIYIHLRNCNKTILLLVNEKGTAQRGNPVVSDDSQKATLGS